MTAIVLAGIVLVHFGVDDVLLPHPVPAPTPLISDDWIPLITVLWLLGMTQAINLIDGLDGLAAGIVAIAAGAFFLYSQQAERPRTCSRSRTSGRWSPSSRSGVCVGFLPHNFNPARIIMGDGGALLLGLLLAVSHERRRRARRAASQEFIGQTYFFLAPLVHPAAHPRRADPRHAVRDRPPGRQATGRSPSPTRVTSTTG